MSDLVVLRMLFVFMRKLRYALKQTVSDIPWFLDRVTYMGDIELAYRVAGMVYDEAGGEPTKRPKEFI